MSTPVMLAGPFATPFFHLENGLIGLFHLTGQVEADSSEHCEHIP